MFDDDTETKKQAGVDRLNSYSNYLEIQTLTTLLNCDYEKVLESNDAFCTKMLLMNLEKSTFESKFQRLLQKKHKK